MKYGISDNMIATIHNRQDRSRGRHTRNRVSAKYKFLSFHNSSFYNSF